MCGGVGSWGWRAKTLVLSKGSTDPSAQSHQNPSRPLCGTCWWVLDPPGSAKALERKSHLGKDGQNRTRTPPPRTEDILQSHGRRGREAMAEG